MKEPVIKRKSRGMMSVITLLAGGLIGCSIISSNSTPIVEGEADTSKYVKLSMCIPSSPSMEAEPGYGSIVEGLNQKLEENLNAHVEVTFIPGRELGIQYPLIFDSNESYDILYASIRGRPGYFKLAHGGHLMPLDELLPQYAEDTIKGIEPKIWEDIEYEGKVYGIPFGGSVYGIDGYIYREDLLLKYGLPTLGTIKDMETYMDAILGGEGDLIPLALNEDGAIGLYDMFIDLETPWIPAPGIPKSSLYLVAKDLDRSGDIFHPAFTKEFMEFAKMMKTWGDRGYWQGDIFESWPDGAEMLNSHQAASILGNAGIYDLERTVYPNSIDLEEGKLRFLSFGEKRGKIIRGSGAENLIVFSEGSKDVGRAVMVAEYIISERDSLGLLNYGFRGEIGDIGAGETQNHYGAMAVEDPYAKFPFDSADLDREIDGILKVNSRYGIPILLGKCGDPEKAVLNYRRDLEDAGIDKLIETVKEQLQAIDKVP